GGTLSLVVEIVGNGGAGGGACSPVPTLANKRKIPNEDQAGRYSEWKMEYRPERPNVESGDK
ncbi:hypothetical protein J6590_103979, partial [Homalodisca vitripennis]